ncbi:hypothetical protein B0H67DRAFT_642207 [Lasiosphaeris hirsuta]|uniref:Uncharacterized protein n=1 Tax=Lasiosphaeris hirsuta TaxID=260670 RepID=A0AA40B1N0_9PEZI|nr:hypothetical protein B0H67DRAFT_642207 [Lasiosphaeris hirsuta]
MPAYPRTPFPIFSDGLAHRSRAAQRISAVATLLFGVDLDAIPVPTDQDEVGHIGGDILSLTPRLDTATATVGSEVVLLNG